MSEQLEQLQNRIQEVKKLQDENKWAEAASLMLEIKDKALELFNDELASGMAEFYYRLGDALVCKIEFAQDLFGQQVKAAEEGIKSDIESDEEQSQEEKPDQQPLEKPDQNSHEKPEIKSSDQDKQEKCDDMQEEQEKVEKVEQNGKSQLQEELDGDYQVAWENLETAQHILDREFKKHEENQFEREKRDQIVKKLARVHQRKAELEQWRDNFEVALQEHQKALNLRLLVDDKEKSRDIAESYFLLGNVHSYIGNSGWEPMAMDCFKKALQILENNLSDELNLPRKDLSNVDKENPTTYHLGSSFMDTPKTEELKQVIKLIYEKIEDVKIGLKEQQSEEFKKLQKEYQELREQQTQQFSQPTVQNAPVIKLGSFGNATRIKQNKEDADNEPENYEVSPQKKIKDQ